MTYRFGWIAIALIGLAACGGDDDEPGDQAANGGPAARRDSVVRAPVYPEGEAAEIFRMLNAGEVAAARVARERSQNDEILRFASVMISDHNAMTQLVDSLSPAPTDTTLRNAEARQLKEQGARMVDSLWAIVGGFNNTYIEQQVRDHERALLLLDTALIPSARSAELKRLLTQLRPALVAHLQRAKQIWSARMSNPELATPTRPAPVPSPTPTQPRPQTQPQPTPQPVPPPVQHDTLHPPPTSTSNM